MIYGETQMRTVEEKRLLPLCLRQDRAHGCQGDQASSNGLV